MQSQITQAPTAEQIRYKTTLANPTHGNRPTCGCDMWVDYGRCRHISEMKEASKK
jgi:hypothetical protein